MPAEHAASRTSCAGMIRCHQLRRLPSSRLRSLTETPSLRSCRRRMLFSRDQQHSVQKLQPVSSLCTYLPAVHLPTTQTAVTLKTLAMCSHNSCSPFSVLHCASESATAAHSNCAPCPDPSNPFSASMLPISPAAGPSATLRTHRPSAAHLSPWCKCS